ncbi:glycosyl hydrolase family 61-domain-containing protein [Geopyxis carbonaria]|nr:glycosyl hydrolase family 61-domain-containing protein [Geopyxis carbonaria]
MNADKSVCLAGSRVVAQWRTWPDGSQDVPLDVSHKGPCAVYMKRMGSNGAGTVAGGGWFKIWHDGVTNGLWCSERVRTNNQMAFTIPKSLQGGYYTLRMEQLALHEARVYGEAQWYFGCAQIFVYGTGGNDVPTNTVSIPGYVDYNHPGVLINIYDFPGEHPTNYQIPGPVPFVGSNTGGGAAIEPSVPFNPRPNYRSCIVKNANWCGVTLPNFTNVATCYAATENCANQETACYASAPPTGYQGCSYWGQLCEMARQKCASCENSPGSACQGPFPGFPTRNVF